MASTRGGARPVFEQLGVGAYTVDEAARRHGAGVEEETTDADVAYARFAQPVVTGYQNGWLPDD